MTSKLSLNQLRVSESQVQSMFDTHLHEHSYPARRKGRLHFTTEHCTDRLDTWSDQRTDGPCFGWFPPIWTGNTRL